eukprot:6457-Heterococcus_DN1.PRE.1
MTATTLQSSNNQQHQQEQCLKFELPETQQHQQTGCANTVLPFDLAPALIEIASMLAAMMGRAARDFKVSNGCWVGGISRCPDLVAKTNQLCLDSILDRADALLLIRATAKRALLDEILYDLTEEKADMDKVKRLSKTFIKTVADFMVKVTNNQVSLIRWSTMPSRAFAV